jgi:hypothetical protein
LDISRVQEYLQDRGVLWGSGPCDQRTPVVDLQHLGGEKMVGGSIARFLDRYQVENAVDLEETEALEHVVN